LWEACEELSLAGQGGKTNVRAAVLLAICLTPILAFAQNDNWLGGTGFWSDGTKWSVGVPTSSNSVFIDNGKAGASPVTINFNGAQCANLTIDSDDSLTLVDGTIFTLYGPTISNAGSILLNSAGFGTYFDFGGAVTLTGAGTLTMSNSSGNYLMGYAQPSPGASLTNKSTIQGAGNIGFSGGIGSGNSFINQGTVNANQTTPLLINIGSASTVKNTGALEATNGATLELDNGTITNTGGVIHADPASTVSLYTSTVSGGTLTTSGTGIIEAICCLGYSTLNGVTLNGIFQLNNNNIGYLGGTITNNGSLQINSTGSGTTLDVVGAVTLKGTGTLNMSNNASNYIMGYGQASPGASLTSQITIRGAGNIGFTGGIGAGNSFTNQATINADQAANPFLINAGSGTVTNTGTLEATSGATLQLWNGTITNTGGIIHADPASIVSLYNVTVSGGTLTTSSTGTIEAVCCLGYSTLDGVTLNGTGTFQWVSNNIGYLQGTITNNSAMKFTAPSGTNVVLDVNGAVTLKGTGTLTSTNSSNAIMGYAQSTGASLLNQSTIQGTVGISAFNGNTITNQGTIFANQTSPLTIGTGNGGTFTNAGTPTAGTLKVNKGSALYVTGAGFTNFSGSTLTGGKYMVSGTLGFDGANILSNAASITLTGSTAQIINDLNSANALANFATNSTTGSFSLLSGKIFNTTVTSGNFSNAGKLTVGVGSGLQVSAPSPLVPTYTQTAGTTTVDGVLTANGGVKIQAGKLFGKGTIAASVVSSGSVTAGDSLTKAGKLSPSTYTQNATGSLNIQIGGLTAGTQYSQLAVANGAKLNGTLNIKLINSFVPAIGNTFTIVTGSAVSGTFATVNGLSINSGEHFTIAYNPTNVTLTVVSGP
jgi:hypothetical protein